MPAYPHGKGKWRVIFHLQGKRHTKVVEGSKSEAEAWEARERVRLESAGAVPDTRTVPTFLTFCAAHYRPHAEAHLKKATWRNRQYSLATLAEHFGGLKLTDIKTTVIEEYKAKRLAAGIRPSTINDELKVLLAVRSYAKDLGFPVADAKVKKLKVRGKRRVHAWTEEEVRRLLDAVVRVSPSILPLVVFLLNTGCRKGEALALQWQNVDLERRVIVIWPSDEWQPKDDEPREIPISDALMPWLAMPVEQRPSTKWVFPAPRKVRRGEAPPSERYVMWPQRKFDRARASAVPEAQLQTHKAYHKGRAWSCSACRPLALTGGPHTTRHTYATHFLAREPNIFLLARILGHSTAHVTELYGHMLPDQMARARAAVNFEASITPAAFAASKKWRVEPDEVVGAARAEKERR